MTAKLSPYTQYGLSVHSTGCEADHSESSSKEKRRNKPIWVDAYKCPVCGDLHEDEDDAADCCAFREQPVAARSPHAEESVFCPVCGSAASDYRHAVDCCLWRDVDAPTRWRIADAVEAGAEWMDAIHKEIGQ